MNFRKKNMFEGIPITTSEGNLGGTRSGKLYQGSAPSYRIPRYNQTEFVGRAAERILSGILSGAKFQLERRAMQKEEVI